MKMNLEKKVGIFFIVGVLLLIGLVEMSEEIVVFKKRYTLKANFDSVSGLRVDDTVALAGVEVGRVQQINVLKDKIEVVMRLDRRAEVRADSIARIKMTSLLGEKYVDITLGTPGVHVVAHNTTIRTRESLDINNMVARIDATATEARDLFSSFNQNQKDIAGRISKILDENEGDIQAAIKSFSEAGPKLSQVLDSIKTTTDKIDRGEGTFGKLLSDNQLYKEAKETAANLKDISIKVNSGQGTLGKLVNDPTLYDEATRTVREVGEAAEGLQEGAPIMTFSTILFGLAQ